LASRIWPGPGVSAGSTNSSPVDKTLTRGRRVTATGREQPLHVGRRQGSAADLHQYADHAPDGLDLNDRPTLERVVRLYREGGWPAEVEGDAFTAPFSAPSAGPPPWHLYLFTFHTAFGVATAEPYGATRWRFER
jgi:hypothetical protein